MQLHILVQANLKAWNSGSHFLRSLVTPWPLPIFQWTWVQFLKTLLQGSSVPLALPMELWSSSFGRKMALFNFVSTSKASNFQEIPIPTSAHFQPPQCTMKSMRLHQDWPPACVPSCPDNSWRQMEDWILNLLQFIWVVGNAWRAY